MFILCQVQIRVMCNVMQRGFVVWTVLQSLHVMLVAMIVFNTNTKALVWTAKVTDCVCLAIGVIMHDSHYTSLDPPLHLLRMWTEKLKCHNISLSQMVEF